MAGYFTRRKFLTHVSTAAGAISSALVMAGCAGATGPAKTKGRRPNVILLITDDQGYGDLGCHGNTVMQTPNLDALYRQSVRLMNFHVSPTCAPTRASLMTGRYCNRTGVWHTVMGRSLLRKDEVTMADAFRANGYRTAIFGKWHLGDNYPYRPQERGFGEVLVHCGGGVGQVPDYWGNDYFDDIYLHNGRRREFTGYCTDIWFDSALRFIEANRDRPFFVYLATNAPHAPYNVARHYMSLYEGKDVPNPAFCGMIANIDENVGRLRDRLKTLELDRNTVLIFMTDNGTAAGYSGGKGFNAGMRGIKGSEYDGGHRVPCFIHWPAGGLETGADVGRLTAHIDVLPTLIDLCGLRKPQSITFDGTSLAPLLRGGFAAWPERAIVVDSQRIDHPEKWRRCAVMTDRWRLVNGKELYDMSADPGQHNDVARQYPDIVQSLRQTYEKWWAETSGRFGEYCEIAVGSDKDNPATLTCHDWHGDALSDQGAVLNARQANGFWAIEAARSGLYEIALRRWPAQLDMPINAAVAGGRAIRAVNARIKVADLDLTAPVSENDKAAVFRLNLSEGSARLQTWFVENGGESRGAYYVYVRRLSN